ncbi:Keratin 5-like protein [Oopsacas minuta]|uniref:Keratin 5-like protein n=1 Tax=Oopsacas minuta TaxID=111878 RepID=A0AAV7JWL4_9METZ|nr:Keratin 5-like protein [Oopsacas minuta]
MTNRVYIGRLSPAARERDVERFFKPYGRIRDINLKNGFGFVEFDSVRDADEAVYSCDGKDLLGERVLVELAKGGSSYGRRSSPPMSMSSSSFRSGYRGYYYSRGYAKYGPPVRTEYRVVVENLSSRVSWQDLKDFMRVAGRISYADAHRKRVGEGIVEFMAYDDMKTALRKLDGQELHGRTIRLFDGRSRHSPGRRSRSRSRSRSHSHSHSRTRRHSRSYSRSSSSPSPSRGRDRYRERERERDRDRSRDRERKRRSRSSHDSRKKRRMRDSHSNESKSESRSPSPIKKSPTNDKYSLKSEAESPEHERSPSESPVKEHSGDEDMRD